MFYLEFERDNVAITIKFNDGEYESSTTVEIKKDEEIILVIIDYDKKRNPLRMEIVADKDKDLQEMVNLAYEAVKDEIIYINHRKNLLSKVKQLMESS